MDLEKLMVDTLQIPMVKAFQPLTPPCVTCYAASDETALFGDGKEAEMIETFQVDIWDRNENVVKILAKKLKRRLIADEHAVSDVSYLYDNNGKVWHASLTFTVISEEE